MPLSDEEINKRIDDILSNKSVKAEEETPQVVIDYREALEQFVYLATVLCKTGVPPAIGKWDAALSNAIAVLEKYKK